jgi:hypothetical protein
MKAILYNGESKVELDGDEIYENRNLGIIIKSRATDLINNNVVNHSNGKGEISWP